MRLFSLNFFCFLLLSLSYSSEVSARYCRNEENYLAACRHLAVLRNKLGHFSSYCRTRIRNLERCNQRVQNVRDVQRMRSTGRVERDGVLENTSVQGISFAGSAARFNTQNCLPRNAPSVVRLIRQMIGMGWSVTVFSGYRPTDYNRRVGGKRRSMHIPCRAADIRVSGPSWETVTQFLQANRVGGLGLYCSFWHIDNGSLRNWGGCSRGSRRRGGYRSPRPSHQHHNRSETETVQ